MTDIKKIVLQGSYSETAYSDEDLDNFFKVLPVAREVLVFIPDAPLTSHHWLTWASLDTSLEKLWLSSGKIGHLHLFEAGMAVSRATQGGIWNVSIKKGSKRFFEGFVSGLEKGGICETLEFLNVTVEECRKEIRDLAKNLSWKIEQTSSFRIVIRK